jgi:hypothetical protein
VRAFITAREHRTFLYNGSRGHFLLLFFFCMWCYIHGYDLKGRELREERRMAMLVYVNMASSRSNIVRGGAMLSLERR